MRCYVYLDNFRGFRNTRIPITDVNFLVGQNSTGKTSTLGLMKLISTPRFFYASPELSDEEVTFGHFSDMVSAHSSDRTYFRVGLAWERRDRGDSEPAGLGWLATFVERDGLPQLESFTFYDGKLERSIRYEGDEILYEAASGPILSSPSAVLDSRLPAWVEKHARRDGDFAKLSRPKGLPPRLPLFIALSIIPVPAPQDASGDRPPSPSSELPSLLPDVFPTPGVTWIAPIRTRPNRTYDELTLAYSPEGGHTPYLIRRMLRSQAAATRFHDLMKRFGRASGLFQDVRIKAFGHSATAPFEVDVLLDAKPLNLSTVGYGVSQALPVLVELLARGKGSWFAIQQPEVHLHPCAQAALGDLFFEMASTNKMVLLVETHSDYALDRFRMNYYDCKTQPPESQVLFFERRDRHNVVTPVPIGRDGKLPADQPPAYRDFFLKEQLRLLGV